MSHTRVGCCPGEYKCPDDDDGPKQQGEGLCRKFKQYQKATAEPFRI